MKLNININDDKVINFSNQAKDELLAQITDISDKLIEEALRVEISERLKGYKQEVTSSIVQKTAELFLQRYNFVKNRKKRMGIEIASLVFMSLTSIFFTIAFQDLSNNVIVLLIAIILLMVGLITSVISIQNKYE